MYGNKLCEWRLLGIDKLAVHPYCKNCATVGAQINLEDFVLSAARSRIVLCRACQVILAKRKQLGLCGLLATATVALSCLVFHRACTHATTANIARAAPASTHSRAGTNRRSAFPSASLRS